MHVLGLVCLVAAIGPTRLTRLLHKAAQLRCVLTSSPLPRPANGVLHLIIMNYEYEALENTPGAIRTFVLRPAEQLDDPILGDLQHVSRESYKYTAVSYVWGNPLHVHSIQI